MRHMQKRKSVQNKRQQTSKWMKYKCGKINWKSQVSENEKWTALTEDMGWNEKNDISNKNKRDKTSAEAKANVE